MTLMLASVTSPAEAETVGMGGVDIIDLKDPAKGALGALDVGVVADIVRAVAKRKPVSATVGEAFASPDAVVDAVTTMASTGVDFVKVGFSSDQPGARCIRALASLTSRVKLVGVLFADREPDLDLLRLMAEQGFDRRHDRYGVKRGRPPPRAHGCRRADPICRAMQGEWTNVGSRRFARGARRAASASAAAGLPWISWILVPWPSP